jgi:hypothetical protein
MLAPSAPPTSALAQRGGDPVQAVEGLQRVVVDIDPTPASPATATFAARFAERRVAAISPSSAATRTTSPSQASPVAGFSVCAHLAAPTSRGLFD